MSVENFRQQVEFNKFSEKTMFLRLHIGEAAFPDGEVVEISQNIGGGSYIFTFKDAIYTVTPSQLLDAILKEREKETAKSESQGRNTGREGVIPSPVTKEANGKADILGGVVAVQSRDAIRNQVPIDSRNLPVADIPDYTCVCGGDIVPYEREHDTETTPPYICSKCGETFWGDEIPRKAKEATKGK